MTIDKAIEIMGMYLIPLKTPEDHDFMNAVLLGIEALKLIKSTRPEDWKEMCILLPGETIDTLIGGGQFENSLF